MSHRKVTRIGIGAVLLSLCAAASGQNQWLIDITYSDPAGVVNSLDDTVTVTLWAAFDPQYYAFRQSKLEVTADDSLDAGEWSNPMRLLTGPYSKDGEVNGESVTGIYPTQLHFPEAGIFADTTNPIAAWTATWRTTDLESRRILVTTHSIGYVLYTTHDGVSKDFVDEMSEGLDEIRIIPGSGVLSGLFLGGYFLAARRYRPVTS